MKQSMELKYAVPEEKLEALTNAFTYHDVKEGQAERYVFLRNKAKELAGDILFQTPPSREQSLALTKLEECIMWANAAIARHE
jgi:uncharacterized protein YecE (DUF72 family)